MRKVIVSMNVTLDGFMSGPNCELDWHTQSWTAEMAEVACEQLSQADTILFGRITYSAMAKYWTSKAINLTLAREDIDFADMLAHYSKIVFSNTLSILPWNNSRLVKEKMKEEILHLKHQAGKDMIIYGSGKLVSVLVQWGLVDEFQVWVHPILLGKGKPLFKDLQDKLQLSLYKTRKFSSGVVMLYYACSHSPVSCHPLLANN